MGYICSAMEEEAKNLRRLLRKADEIVGELNQRAQLTFHDLEIMKEFGLEQSVRYSEMTPPDMFRRIMQLEGERQ